MHLKCSHFLQDESDSSTNNCNVWHDGLMLMRWNLNLMHPGCSERALRGGMKKPNEQNVPHKLNNMERDERERDLRLKLNYCRSFLPRYTPGDFFRLRVTPATHYYCILSPSADHSVTVTLIIKCSWPPPKMKELPSSLETIM